MRLLISIEKYVSTTTTKSKAMGSGIYDSTTDTIFHAYAWGIAPEFHLISVNSTDGILSRSTYVYSSTFTDVYSIIRYQDDPSDDRYGFDIDSSLSNYPSNYEFRIIFTVGQASSTSIIVYSITKDAIYVRQTQTVIPPNNLILQIFKFEECSMIFRS